ncbi:MAG: T9SS type A sorting domain-containing protein [Bacteroidetes bacterium]|nr:T9SS type A sorting domain-containing protein [Bacteroidota bacterium]
MNNENMYKNIQSFVFLLTLFLSNHLFSQLAIGDWREHLPYSHAKCVAEADNKIYCSTDIGLFSFNKNDNSVEKYSKISGLSDIGINSIRYHQENEVLMIAYSNTNIDLIENNTIYNISDIKRKPNLGNKTINNILFLGNIAYLSCGFGIVVIDLDKKEIKDTYYIGNNGTKINVLDLTFDGANLYAATESGIYKADINNQNLANYAYWHKITNIPNANSEFNCLEYFGGKVLMNYRNEATNDDTLYVYDGLSWDYFVPEYNKRIYSLDVSYDKLLISSTSKLLTYNQNFERTNMIYTYGHSSVNPHHAIIDNENTIWIADNTIGLIKTNNDWNAEPAIYPNGPDNSKVVDLEIAEGDLWAATGGKNGSWTNLWNKAEVFSFIENEWNTYNNNSISKMSQAIDIIKVKIDPLNNKHLFAASWGGGILEFMNGELIEIYNDSNSSLQNIIPGSKYVRVGGLVFDDDNNLWATNSEVANPISVKKASGTWSNGEKWISFPYGNTVDAPTLSEILVTQYGHKWVVLARGYGLFAFDNNRTIENFADDQTKQFDVVDENGKIISNNIFSIAEDREGTIWIGTNKGVLVYYNPSSVFDQSNFYAQKVILEIDGSAQYLLETETVSAIEIDGANRKWFGTENAGVFLMSEDGTEQILNFNTDNSPLLSNTITSIAIDENSGEVFFGTANGIISYRGTAIEPKDNFNDIYVFPNPVRENYSGDITVKGVVENSNVKITDVSGNLVFETTALGGQAIWNGNNFSGERVHTGVYMVFCSNEDGTQTHVTKLLFIN